MLGTCLVHQMQLQLDFGWCEQLTQKVESLWVRWLSNLSSPRYKMDAVYIIVLFWLWEGNKNNKWRNLIFSTWNDCIVRRSIDYKGWGRLLPPVGSSKTPNQLFAISANVGNVPPAEEWQCEFWENIICKTRNWLERMGQHLWLLIGPSKTKKQRFSICTNGGNVPPAEEWQYGFWEHSIPPLIVICGQIYAMRRSNTWTLTPPPLKKHQSAAENYGASSLWSIAVTKFLLRQVRGDIGKDWCGAPIDSLYNPRKMIANLILLLALRNI